MNITEYKAQIKTALGNAFPDLETQMGTTNYNRLITGITRRPIRYLLNELDARTGTGKRYDQIVATLRTEFGIDIE